jgi:NAD dependent epimerase/dehydratase family enzyme
VTREVLCASQRALPVQLQRTGYSFALPAIEDALAVAVAPVAAPGRAA